MSQKKFECLILAGGFGTRLKPINPSKPKPLIEISQKPFLFYQLNFLKNCGIKSVLISTGFQGEQIDNWVKNLDIPDLKISCIQENIPLGTGGAIKNAIDFLEDDFVVCNGDTISIFDLSQMMNFHMKKNSILTMLIKKISNSTRYGSVKINPDNQIIKFQDKTSLKNVWISAGYFIFHKNNIDWGLYPDIFSYEDLFQKLIETSYSFGFTFDDYFIDIGTPQSFEKFQNDFSKNNKLKILFK